MSTLIMIVETSIADWLAGAFVQAALATVAATSVMIPAAYIRGETRAGLGGVGHGCILCLGSVALVIAPEAAGDV